MRRAIPVAVALALAAAAPARAAAQDAGGAVTAHLLFAGEDWGGGGIADIWMPVGPLWIGGALGAAAITSDADSRSRVLMPFGASVAWPIRSGSFGVELRARGGGWAGATHQGLAAGAWLALGLYFEYALGPDVALSAGLDAWMLAGHGDRFPVLPGIGIVWTPADIDSRDLAE